MPALQNVIQGRRGKPDAAGDIGSGEGPPPIRISELRVAGRHDGSAVTQGSHQRCGGRARLRRVSSASVGSPSSVWLSVYLWLLSSVVLCVLCVLRGRSVGRAKRTKCVRKGWQGRGSGFARRATPGQVRLRAPCGGCGRDGARPSRPSICVYRRSSALRPRSGP